MKKNLIKNSGWKNAVFAPLPHASQWQSILSDPVMRAYSCEIFAKLASRTTPLQINSYEIFPVLWYRSCSLPKAMLLLETFVILSSVPWKKRLSMVRLSIKFFTVFIVASVILLPRFAAGSSPKVRRCIYFNTSSRETILIFSIHEEHFEE